VLVHAAIAEELCETLRTRVAGLVAGDPSDAATDVGPLISEASARRAHRWVAESRSDVLAGGDRSGSVLAATLLADVPLDAQIMRDEIFAPVVAVRAVRDLDEAVAIANDTAYGLQAGVFTRDVEVAFAAARRLRVGGVMINDTSSYHADAMPYGGVKASGYGLEGPRYAVHVMTDPRIIVLNLGGTA
jgi:acyl-CoA reductase-like NAD-dependent aldehyde dehydrogenase